MTQVKVGQVWKDKDKRRNTVIEIIKVLESGDVMGLVVGTEDVRGYSHERLTKRWELIEEKPEIKAAASKNWQLKAVCQENDDYKVRFTKRIAEVYGMPLCPCHKKPLVFTEGH
ncbi:hypothetical protein QEH45_gp55 [Microbacterium phage Shocker]|uniref:Uncharacterized protein n=1 Tax=Microbacterium phage Shocker TaxID=2805839 RepID=A0A890UQU6_9CAUD|nr:hypothetical protein QEH45_gp55 [Microbacterium phage Shocker]QRI45109.1 hypothetical protein SEA_SHOCKER_55 [Microbacterium phage Shocker]